jgi:hypothetical protein
MRTSELIQRYMLAKQEARVSRDNWVRTGDPVWLQISRIQIELARTLHTAVIRRIHGFKTPK